MITDKVEFKQQYTDFKRRVLFDEDIQILTSINERVLNFVNTKDLDILISYESELASFGYQLAGILGRLSGQVAFEKDRFSKKVSDISKERKEGKKPKDLIGLKEEIKSELSEDQQDLVFLEAIYDEYNKRFSSLSDIHLAITHKMKRIEKSI